MCVVVSPSFILLDTDAPGVAVISEKFVTSTPSSLDSSVTGLLPCLLISMYNELVTP